VLTGLAKSVGQSRNHVSTLLNDDKEGPLSIQLRPSEHHKARMTLKSY
jgi:hypothetical protein